MDEQDLLLLATTLCIYYKTKKPKKKRMKPSNHPWLPRINNIEHVTLSRRIILEPSDWRSYLRMDEESYFHLLNMVAPLIKKKDTNMRQCISAHDRLLATLRFLASGMNYEDLKYNIGGISSQSLGKIIPETCRAILACLKDYIQMPTELTEWKVIAQGFEEKWGFPHCLGAVDGKHVRINPTPRNGSLFFNCKNFHSVILIGCVNANYEFIWCEVDPKKKMLDGGIKNTKFYEKLMSGDVNIPSPEPVQRSILELPYVFVGEDIPSSDFMKPFPQEMLNSEREIFNHRFSRASRVIENAFGIMANRFRIFQTCINLDLQKTELILQATCILHNFLIKHSSGYVASEDMSYDELIFEYTLPSLQNLHCTTSGNNVEVRETFTDYFNGKGEIKVEVI